VTDPGWPALFVDGLEAVVFDTDGVLTDTASVHAVAWKRLFDEYLQLRAVRDSPPFQPFTEVDYLAHVDGRPRDDGVAGFLASRGIQLPWGDLADPPDRETVCGLGNAKDQFFVAHLRDHGAQAFPIFPTSVAFVRRLRERGLRTAAVSASRNMVAVLEAAGLRDLFEVEVDGVEADRLGLAGKPDPALFLEAARRLGVAPARAAVVQDALAGVEAGRRGRFAVVVGLDRGGQAAALIERGADVVVAELQQAGVTRGCGPADRQCLTGQHHPPGGSRRRRRHDRARLAGAVRPWRPAAGQCRPQGDSALHLPGAGGPRRAELDRPGRGQPCHQARGGGAAGTAGPAAGWAAPGPGAAGRHPGRGQGRGAGHALVRRLGRRDRELHVFDVATVPRFWDRPEHDHAAWSREFLGPQRPGGR
jgi:HAD superfamily hydrolase (TIGR01509 family)